MTLIAHMRKHCRSIVDGVPQRLERWLARTKCTDCRLGFTVYPPGHYPHRQYQLDIVANVTERSRPLRHRQLMQAGFASRRAPCNVCPCAVVQLLFG